MSANNMQTVKNRRISKTSLSRLKLVFAVIVVTIIILAIRILYLQNSVDAKKVSSLSNTITSSVIPYRRGNITDRNGTLLATSEKVYNIILDCKIIKSDDGRYYNKTLDKFCELFPEFNRNELEETIEKNSDSSYIILAREKKYEEVEQLLKVIEDTKNNSDFAGIWLEEKYKRIYPFGSLACDVIGFTYKDGSEGNTGLESFYNGELSGINGRKYQRVADGLKENIVKNPTDGLNIVSTIDYNIQSMVEKHIKQFDEQYSNNIREGNGAQQIAVIVADPNNGEILAESNFPNFDLNNPFDPSLTSVVSADSLFVIPENASDEQKTAINNDKITYMQEIWKNFCVTDSYEPGSTQKPFTVAAALESGSIHGDEKFICDGVEEVGGYQIHCVNKQGHGEETVSMAISNSCNDVLMQIAARIGFENFIKYQNLWGFGKKTNIDLPSEFNCSSLVYTLETMHDTELATSSFGQGYNVTMTQMVAAFSSLINGGNYYQPHIVKKISDSNGSTIRNMGASLVRKTVSKETSEIVKSYLYDTVMSGTGNTAHVDGYSMGGKTGTAEKHDRDKQNYLVSFIGYAPADNPQVVIYVVIDTPNVQDQAHSSFSQQIAHDIMAEVLPYMNIFPDMEVSQIQVPAGEQPQEQAPPAEGQAGEQTPQEEGGSVFEDNMPFPLIDNQGASGSN